MAFVLSENNKKIAEKEIKKYPQDRKSSAVKSILHLAQKQNGGWINQEIIEYVSNYLEMPHIRVHEVASFYNMFHLNPVGKYNIQFCGTTPCMLCGSEDLMKNALNHMNIKLGEVTSDGFFSAEEVECVGACSNAPVVMINDDYYEDLTSENLIEIIDALKEGKEVKTGSYTGRKSSEPIGYNGGES